MSKKSITVIDNDQIACNPRCAKIKELGLPHSSLWLMISHLISNLEYESSLTDQQKSSLEKEFHDYLATIKGLKKAEAITRQGVNFLADIDRFRLSSSNEKIRQEQEFIHALLHNIARHVTRIYSSLDSESPGNTIDTTRQATLQALTQTNDKKEILRIVEKSFTTIHKSVELNQERIKHSLDCLQNLEAKTIINPLTGIYNRRYFDQELPKLIKTFLDMKGRKPFSLLAVDLDNFKEINDLYGHLIGDQVLQRIGAILQHNCRAGIDSPIRQGGDEFALFLVGAPLEGAKGKAELIRQKIAGSQLSFSHRNHLGQSEEISLRITASIGVAELQYDWQEVPAKELLANHYVAEGNYDKPHHKLATKLALAADEALYQAKQGGKNKVQLYMG